MYKIWVTCVPLSVSGWMGHLHDGVILLLRPESFSCIFGYPKIHHLHISPHSPPCLAPPTPTPPPPKKNCRSNVINFSWYHCNTQEKLETKFILWEICKRRICKTLKDSGRSSKIMSSLIWPIAKFVTNLLSVLCFYVLCLLAKKHSTETNQVTSSTGN